MRRYLPECYHDAAQQAVVQKDMSTQMYFLAQMMWTFTTTRPVVEQSTLLQTSATVVAVEMMISANNTAQADTRLLTQLPHILKRVTLADMLMITTQTIITHSERCTHQELLDGALAAETDFFCVL